MKILLVDDHALFRDGLARVLQELGENTITLEAENAQQAFETVDKNPDLDLVLLDLNLPEQNGFTILSHFSKQHPMLPVIIISASEKTQDMHHAIEQGAMGYIGKGSRGEVMLNAIRLVMAGEIYMPSSLLKKTQQNQSNITNSLTQRQKSVLQLMDQGLANKHIADKLNITEATVKMHITAIFKTLQVSNRTQAVLKAQQEGIV